MRELADSVPTPLASPGSDHAPGIWPRYVDTALSLIERGGSAVSDDIWHRLVQIVTGTPSLQPYAATRVFQSLNSGVDHEVLVKAAAYVLGEFSRVTPGLSATEVFQSLHRRFGQVSGVTKSLLLSSYMKLVAGQPGGLGGGDRSLVQEVAGVLRRQERSTDSELQQRAVQYLQLLTRPGVAAPVFDVLPPLPEKKLTESNLLKKLREKEGDTVEEEVQQAQQVQGMYDAAPAAAGPGGPAINGAAYRASAAQQPAVVSDLLADLDLGGPPVPVQPAATGYGGGGDDLLDLLGSPGAPQHAAPAGGLDDLLGASPAVPAPAAGAPALPPIQPTGAPQGWYKKLLAANQGVLYQDQYLQVGIRAAWRGAQGRVEFFFGNRPDSPASVLGLSLERLQCTVQADPAHWKQAWMQPVPASVPAGQQLPVTLAVALLHPAARLPALSLSYSVGAQSTSVQLQLPAPPTKFLAPITGLTSEQFFGRWKATPQSQQMAHAAAPLAPESLGEQLGALGLGVCPGIDPNPRNAVAAATISVEGQGPVRGQTGFGLSVGRVPSPFFPFRPAAAGPAPDGGQPERPEPLPDHGRVPGSSGRGGHPGYRYRSSGVGGDSFGSEPI